MVAAIDALGMQQHGCDRLPPACPPADVTAAASASIARLQQHQTSHSKSHTVLAANHTSSTTTHILLRLGGVCVIDTKHCVWLTPSTVCD